MPVEPISLSIGAVALVSVFTTCVECFEYIDATKSCGRDLELLAIKFAIEKTRFLIWGESVGLSSNDDKARSTKLDSPLCRPIVEQTLNCIRLLFTDTHELSERYGLKPSDSQETALAGKPSSGFKGSSQLRVSYDRFMARMQANQQQVCASQKVRWAIRDKRKFGCLVEDTRQLINGLEAITDSLEMAAIRKARIKEELDSVDDLEDLGIVAEASAQINKEWSDAASAVLENSTVADSHHERIREWALEGPFSGLYRSSKIANLDSILKKVDMAQLDPDDLMAEKPPNDSFACHSCGHHLVPGAPNS
ncbi:MAG: hypothetical protein LQ346_007353 [Caloplaca aetnensis]|nr:MAG: hypothetical protein LQ346_007353 [Caloplaca aetnensis]